MQELYADVIVDITSDSLDRVFQYRVPEEMRPVITPGMVVEIPFGKGNRLVRGYVTGTGNCLHYDADRVKDLARIVTEDLKEEDRLAALAVWMREHYGCTMLQALKTVLPVKRKVRSREKKVLSLLLDQPAAAKCLEKYEKKHQSARARLLRALLEDPVLPEEIVREKLHITTPVIQNLAEQGVLSVTSERKYRNPLETFQELKRGTEEAVSPESEKAASDQGLKRGPEDISQKGGEQPADDFVLNEEQQAIIRRITGEWDDEAAQLPYLIHGITGSGKTQVYIELIAYALSRGRQAIVLIPEIALTYQTVMRFYHRFGDRVSLINSRLSAGERYDQFERAGKGEIDVMIGPRSALFTPFARLGIIVIDEEHETAYQSETMPRYHAREVALQRARMEGAITVFGSATPSLESYFAAMNGKMTLLKMERRAGAGTLADVRIVDMRTELREGNRSMISRVLDGDIQTCLNAGRQVMLFLNRRGYAGFVTCLSCGEVLKCPHCDVSLSLHNTGQMICHYCGYSQPAPGSCPVCGSGLLRSLRAGTQQIENEVHRKYPAARILRMDLDTTRQKDSYTRILSAFSGHEADILIGTQMIVKGHDFPDVTVVGILAADMSLNVPDYRSAERTFQLLTQAAGRAGRGENPGHVVIQSYQPEHYSIQCSARQDYEAFYEREISFRMLAGYPPAGALTAVHVSGPDEVRLATACTWLKKYADRFADRYQVTILGPADEPIAKIQDIYRKVMYLKHDNPALLQAVRKKLEQYIEVNEGFHGLTIQYDVG